MKDIQDVIIVGLGAMGSAAAYQLAKRGEKVLGIEQFGPAHDLGSSHGGSRIIRQAYYEGEAYVPLLQRAYELWRALERDSGRQLLTITGGLMMGLAESDVVAGSIASAQRHNLPHEVLSAADIRSRFPMLKPENGVQGIFEREAGHLHPEHCINAFLDQAVQQGAKLRFYEPVTRWRVKKNGNVTVTTAQSSYEAKRLIISPGPWAPNLLSNMKIKHAVERIAQFWLAPEGGVGQFRAPHFPVFLWEIENGIKLYGFPSHDGPRGGVKVAFYPTGQWTTADTVEREVQESEIEEMRGYLRGRIPALQSGTCLMNITCLHTFSPDNHFILAPHPKYPSVLVASGFSGHGFKFASVIGEILADLAAEGETQHNIEMFSPARFKV